MIIDNKFEFGDNVKHRLGSRVYIVTGFTVRRGTILYICSGAKGEDYFTDYELDLVREGDKVEDGVILSIEDIKNISKESYITILTKAGDRFRAEIMQMLIDGEEYELAGQTDKILSLINIKKNK